MCESMSGVKKISHASLGSEMLLWAFTTPISPLTTLAALCRRDEVEGVLDHLMFLPPVFPLPAVLASHTFFSFGFKSNKS